MGRGDMEWSYQFESFRDSNFAFTAVPVGDEQAFLSCDLFIRLLAKILERAKTFQHTFCPCINFLGGLDLSIELL